MSNKLSQTSKQAERVKAYYMRIINANQESFGRQMKERDVKYKAVEKQWIQDTEEFEGRIKQLEKEMIKVYTISGIIIFCLSMAIFYLWN